MRDGLIAGGAIVCAVFLAVGAMTVLSRHEPCAIGACPVELHQDNTGSSFTYAVKSQFTVVLDQQENPADILRCLPNNVISRVAGGPSIMPPMYTVQFEAVAPGECKLMDNHFVARIIVVPRPTGTF